MSDRSPISESDRVGLLDLLFIARARAKESAQEVRFHADMLQRCKESEARHARNIAALCSALGVSPDHPGVPLIPEAPAS